MMTDEKLIAYLISGLILGVIIGYIFGKVRTYNDVRLDRKKSITKSKSVIYGGVYEKILPLLPNFPYNPSDLVFVGKGFDYLVLDGLTETGYVRKVVFLEVKTGKSQLNIREKKIRACIQARNVEYREWRG